MTKRTKAVHELLYERAMYDSADLATEASRQVLLAETYDERGDLVEQTEWMRGRPLTRKYERLAGRLHAIHEYADDGALRTKTLFTYDEQGRLGGTTVLNSRGESVYVSSSRYDSQGRKMEEEIHIGNDLKKRFAFLYNERGLAIERFSYVDSESGRLEVSSNGEWFVKGTYAVGELVGKIVYEYDEQGRVTTESSYDGWGKIVGREVYRYLGDQDQTTENMSYGPDGGLISKTLQRVEEYDAEGNWLRLVKLTASGESSDYRPDSITYRRITYFELKPK